MSGEGLGMGSALFRLSAGGNHPGRSETGRRELRICHDEIPASKCRHSSLLAYVDTNGTWNVSVGRSVNRFISRLMLRIILVFIFHARIKFKINVFV